MPLARRLFAVVAVLFASVPVFAQALPTDPSLVTGTLDNGLGYIVKKHSIPPGRAVMWIHMYSGSLNETEHQRGIAHYTEHMAFNGSDHFAPGTLVPFFESLGMTFGRDQNAFTNMEQTTYQLTLPKADTETLGKGMDFFSDIVGHLSLLPKEIDDERQIIQEERRRGLSGRQRTGFYVTEHLTPGSIYGQRITIGTEDSINGVHETDFRDYYNSWYCASNATLIVVADADPNDVVKVIKDKFAGLPKRPRPTPQALNVKAYDKSFAIVASDPELRDESFRIVRLEPARPPVTTSELYRANLLTALGEACFNRRIENKIDAGNTSYTSGRVSAGDESGAIYTAELFGRAKPGKWKESLNELAVELQRARAFGFTQHELDDIKKQMVAGAERAVETEATLPSTAIIGGLNNQVASRSTIMSPKQRLELLKKTLPEISVGEVGQRFAKEFDPTTVAFIAVMPTGPGLPSEAQLLDLGTKALAVKPTQETESESHATELLAKLPAPGQIKEESEHAASKVWNGWLSNNARVHYRFMDDRKNQVTIHIALAGGELLETAADRGITSAAQLPLRRPSTQHLTSTDIRELMNGKKVVVGGGGFGGGGRGGRGGGGGGGSADTISLSISGSPEDLESGFQLAYLLLTEPKIEQTSFDQYITTTRQRLQEEGTNPNQVAARLIAQAPFPDNDVLHHPPTIENIDKLTLAAAQARLDKLVKESPIEVTIVGDLPKERALELVKQYIGSLPSRPRVASGLYADARKVTRPKGPRSFDKTVASPTKAATVYSGFYGTDDTNLADSRALGMAARVLSMRMVKEVREEAQLVYSIGAVSRPASTFPGFGTFSASAPTDPAKVPALVAKLSEMYELFAKDGPTDEEIATAKKQYAKDWADAIKEPGTWLSRLQNMDLRGTTLDDFLASPGAYEALTAKQVKDTFAKYYSKDNTIVVVVKPTGEGNDDKADKSGGAEGSN